MFVLQQVRISPAGTTDHALLLCSHLRLRGGGPRPVRVCRLLQGGGSLLPPPPPTLRTTATRAYVIRRLMEAVKHRPLSRVSVDVRRA